MTAVLNHSAPTHPVAFDVCGDLPTGTTVLEASAGTGKTFTIAALAATSPRATPASRSCCSSPSAATPRRSCANASASGW